MFRLIRQSVACLLSTIAIAYGGVDLTPSYHTVDLGGISIQRVHFKDGDRQFAVTISPDTEIQRNAGGAVFRFKSIPLADMALRQSPFSPEIAFSTERLSEYRRVAREQLGAGAEIIEEAEPEFDVLPANNWKSCRLNFTSKQAGFLFKTDVTFLNLSKDQQIIIVTASKEANFPDIQVRAHKIMSRWHMVLPGDELGLN